MRQGNKVNKECVIKFYDCISRLSRILNCERLELVGGEIIHLYRVSHISAYTFVLLNTDIPTKRNFKCSRYYLF